MDVGDDIKNNLKGAMCTYVTPNADVYNLAGINFGKKDSKPATEHYEELSFTQQHVAFSLCKNNLSNNTMKKFLTTHTCPNVKAYAFHVEGGKCTAFTAKPHKVGDLSPKSSLLMSKIMGGGKTNQGISLSYQVAGS